MVYKKISKLTESEPHKNTDKKNWISCRSNFVCDGFILNFKRLSGKLVWSFLRPFPTYS